MNKNRFYLRREMKIMKNNELVCIEDFIPVGYENRIKRKELVTNTGLTDQCVRKLISKSQKQIVNIDNGYFIVRPDSAIDREKAADYYRREQARAKSILKKNRKFRDYADEFPGQIEIAL